MMKVKDRINKPRIDKIKVEEALEILNMFKIPLEMTLSC